MEGNATEKLCNRNILIMLLIWNLALAVKYEHYIQD
jgi:hypothetical protein